MVDFYQALVDHCTHESLETIKVDIAYGTEGPPTDAHVLPGEALKLLCCFSTLVEVSIMASAGYHLDNATMTELDHRPSATLQSLRTLARHCPYLHTPEMTFDASSVPESPPELHLREHLLHPSLASLDVAHSPISAAFNVARYISEIFLNLTEIATAKEDWTPDEEDTDQDRAEIRYHELWKQLGSFLTGLNDIRAEEYHWGTQSVELYALHPELVRR